MTAGSDKAHHHQPSCWSVNCLYPNLLSTNQGTIKVSSIHLSLGNPWCHRKKCQPQGGLMSTSDSRCPNHQGWCPEKESCILLLRFKPIMPMLPLLTTFARSPSISPNLRRIYKLNEGLTSYSHLPNDLFLSFPLLLQKG